MQGEAGERDPNEIIYSVEPAGSEGSESLHRLAVQVNKSPF